MKLRTSLLILAFASLALANQTKAANNSGSNITVRPFLQNLTISPNDKSKSFDLIITNGSSLTQEFHLSTLNFGALDETGGIAFQGANVDKLAQKYGLANWLSLEKNSLTLSPAQQAEIKVTIKNDSDLSPGAHYAAIIITGSNPKKSSGQVSVTPKVSSLVFATKSGGEQYDMHLESLDHNGTLISLPSQASVRFKSTGNTFIIPRGVISIKQGKTVVARGAINQQSSLVLPETVRNFDVPLTKIGNLKTGLFFTRYSVQVDYRYDGINTYATSSFNYLTINAVSTVVILLLSACTIFLFLKYKKAKAAKNRKPVVKLSRLNK